MNEEKACEILSTHLEANNVLFTKGFYPEYDQPVIWHGSGKARLHGQFAAQELEAIAWWMKNKEVRA